MAIGALLSTISSIAKISVIAAEQKVKFEKRKRLKIIESLELRLAAISAETDQVILNGGDPSGMFGTEQYIKELIKRHQDEYNEIENANIGSN